MPRIFQVIVNHRIKVFVAAGVLLVGGYIFFSGSDETGSATSDVFQKPVSVERGDLRITVSGSGQVEAESQVDLKPVAAGDAIEVTLVAVKNDQEVKKGQVIAVLDNQDAWRDVERAELSLRQAKIKARQTEELYPKKTEDDTRERQIAAASVASSELAVLDARDRLADYTIRAPFDGIVTGLTVDSGDTISQTSVLASVITKRLRVTVSLNEVDAAKVREENAAKLSFDAFPGVVISGVLSKLATIGTIEQGVVSYSAEIELFEQLTGLKPGMSASAEIIVNEKAGVLLVPNAALNTSEGKTTVSVSLGNRRTESSGDAPSAKESREIITGLSNDIYTEVISGLKEGDRVFVASVSATNAPSARTSNQGSLMNIFRGQSSGQSRSMAR